MGTAIKDIFENDYSLICKNSGNFDASDFKQVQSVIEESNADILINTVAFLGIDPCENEPEKAFRLNTLYPKFLAELSIKKEFILIHFSTDAVFNDEKRDFYNELDCPMPVNIYGLTKYGADCFIQNISKKYYIFRVSVLFGETNKKTQFVEKMLEKTNEGEKILKISNDIILTPTYAKDVAREIKRLIEDSYPFGLYHIANEGVGSLCDLMTEIVENLELNVKVEAASYKDFPFIGIKNTFTPIKSEKINSLRPWKKAVKEYCANLKNIF
jgi:dTDP-4-dehydrorhamnose reductase